MAASTRLCYTLVTTQLIPSRSLLRCGPDGRTQLDQEFIGALIKAGGHYRRRHYSDRPGAGAPAALAGGSDTSEDEGPPARLNGPNDLLPADPARYLEVRVMRLGQPVVRF